MTGSSERASIVARASAAAREQAVPRIRQVLRRTGIDVVRHRPGFPEYIDDAAADTLKRVRPFTMTADDSLFSLVESVRYVVNQSVAGCVVECGVWRGGSMMAVALTLLQLGRDDRNLFLYDTFEGMTTPGQQDVLLHDGLAAADMLATTEVGDGANVWCVSGLDEVRAAVSSTGYPQDRVRYVVGPVEQTLPTQSPDEPIALLRLDTDWYESTRDELEHLVPRMVEGAVLVIDDYWHWAGCRRAVDEYLERSNLKILLTKVDITAVGVIVGA